MSQCVTAVQGRGRQSYSVKLVFTFSFFNWRNVILHHLYYPFIKIDFVLLQITNRLFQFNYYLTFCTEMDHLNFQCSLQVSFFLFLFAD